MPFGGKHITGRCRRAYTRTYFKKTYSEITKLVLKDIETLSQSHMIHTHALIYVHARTHLTEDNAIEI